MAKILIGISGSIAAYKTILYLRELRKLNHQCKVILTAGGAQFVTANLIAALGCEVYCDESINLSKTEQAMLHIDLAKWADRFIIAPLSAHTLAKLAHGFADNLLTQAVLAYDASIQPIYLAPAMNQQMWHNLATQANLQLLKERNFEIWEPASGLQACGDNGTGRMIEAEQLVKLTEQTLAPPSLLGKKIIITLGATVEPIDPVRYISNHSSGKMGLALINAALNRGAQVTAIHGKLAINLPDHPYLQKIKALSADEMLEHALTHSIDTDMIIACAAVADYKVANYAPQKIKKNGERITLELIKNPDIISIVKEKFPQLLSVGFAAETEQVIEHAQAKLKTKNLDAIIANNVSQQQVFDQDNTVVNIIQANNLSPQIAGNKSYVAEQIFQQLESLICKI
ncbi:MAG: bifunctional phosphopantothenoylcysteine decarboxylase/phosphopantothenate--cysteine ligase CoaBC [Burkholderiales bacterium]|nr:bifunctional phosphopantothenoylcysteine decarboxylase/phosphopantothenate--cysteine ligase CoaBC [Burkholderiales bacterium]